MNKHYRRTLAAVLLLGLPFNLVHWVRSDAKPLLNTPKSRQQGNPSAKITVVEFSDFQCSACASVEPVIKELMKTHGGYIRFAFKHYPLTSLHKNAFIAAQAAECAAEQNAFWPYHDRLFESQKAWGNAADPRPQFVDYVRELQLNPQKFEQCLNGTSVKFLIDADKAEGSRLKINSTPTFFVNGKRYVGRLFSSEGIPAIEKELGH